MLAAAKPCQSISAGSGMPAAYYQLHALLQTIRELATHEDAICALLSEMQRTGRVSATVRREITAIMAELPVHSLQQEAESLWGAVEQAAA